MNDNYRLIWFQHFHKAAGSFIVRLAINNQEKLYPEHHNGNPVQADQTPIPLWKMSDRELQSFVDNCQAKGITFVATEWGAPNFSVLALDPRVTLITCLRDPLQRLLSNFYFDFWSGYTNCQSIEEYVNSSGSFTMFNYYSRILSQHYGNPEPISLQQFQQAKFNLSLFDCLVILEDPNSFSKLNRHLGWKEDVINKQNRRRNLLPIRRLVKSICKKKLHLWVRRLTHPKKQPDDSFLELFQNMNGHDNHLYIEAKINSLSLSHHHKNVARSCL